MRSRKERDDEIWHLYCSGKSQKELAVEFDMTQGRISQILKPYKQQSKVAAQPQVEMEAVQ